jgi:hypothetical protein
LGIRDDLAADRLEGRDGSLRTAGRLPRQNGIETCPDLSPNLIRLFASLPQSHAAKTHLSALTVGEEDERPPSRTRGVDLQVEPVAIGMVAGLSDRLDRSG